MSTERHEANMRLVLGDAAPLAGRSGNALEITALDVNDTKILTPAVPVPAGSRVVAVQFMASNSGGLPYNDSPATGATVVDAHGTSYPAVTRPAKMQVGQGFRAPLGLAPQAQQIAYVPFIVPQGAKIKKVRFGMDRGTGETAQWRVP